MKRILTLFLFVHIIAALAAADVVVKFKPGVHPLARKLILAGTETGEIPQLRIHTASVEPEALESLPQVEWVEKDQECPIAFTPNDPQFTSPYHYWSHRVRLPQAWDTQIQGAMVAILDTGVAVHPDLVQTQGWNFYDGNADTSDVHGHGTAVAGLAGATVNNGIGIAGASSAVILPIRIASPSAFALFSRMASGIVYATDRGAKAANLSYGGTHQSLAVADAAQYAMERGCVVVVSGGNNGAFDGAADNPHMIRVSATDQTDNVTSWSTFGPSIDIAAPGVNVRTTMRSGGYGNATGTSASSPIVAGVCALVSARNPGWKAWHVSEVVLSTAVDLGMIGRDDWYGHGLANAEAAVGYDPRIKR